MNVKVQFDLDREDLFVAIDVLTSRAEKAIAVAGRCDSKSVERARLFEARALNAVAEAISDAIEDAVASETVAGQAHAGADETQRIGMPPID